MANPRLIQLRDEFTSLRAGIQFLDDKAAAEKRDLTDEERNSYEAQCTRMEAIKVDMDSTLAREKQFDELAATTATIVDAPQTPQTLARTEPRSPVTYDPTKAGQAVARSSKVITDLGEFSMAVARASIDRALGKPEAEDTLVRVVAHGVAADGTAPVTIEGDLIKFVDANRYAVNASRQLPMPDNHAPTFKRPRVTQRTTVAQQVTEGDVLSSQRLQLTGDTVTKTTEGGVLSMSEQEIDWTDPALLGLAIQDLAESYAIATDTVLTAAIVAAASDATETILAAALPAAADFVAAVTAASGVVYAASKKLPDTLFVDINWWTRLIGIVDLDGRPLFPYAGQSVNSSGTNTGGVSSFGGYNVLGLNVVVDPNFAANTMIVAVSSLCEFYEQNKGLLTINAPSTLEVQYAYRGYVAANVYTQGLGLIEAV